MAYATPLKNALPATNGPAWNNIINLLIAAGWTQPWYSDGTTSTINGTPAVNMVADATWQNNVGCGCTMRSPDGKELLFYRGTSVQFLYSMYSAAAGFRDGWVTFYASGVSGNKFSFNDGSGTTRNFYVATGASGSDVNFGAAGNNAVTLAAAFVVAANASTPALAGTFTDIGAGTVKFTKSARTSIVAFANVTGTPLAAFGPSGTKPPVAYDDEKLLFGSGTDQAPVGNTFFGAAGSFRQNGVANAASPYHFAYMSHTAGTGAVLSQLLFDRRTGLDTGTFDDVAVSVATASTYAIAGLCSEVATSAMQGWIGGPNRTDSGWGVLSMVAYFSRGAGAFITTYPGGCPVDPWTAQDTPKLIPYCRRPAALIGNPGPYGPAGHSTLFWWNGATRVVGDITLDGARLCYGVLSIGGWDGTAVTV